VENEIALAATDPEIFEVFVGWLYQQELDRRFHDEVGWAVNDLIDIYFFGDHIQCNGLKNIAMDELQNSHQAGIDQDLDFDHMRRSFGKEEWESKEPIRKFAIAALYWHVWAQGSIAPRRRSTSWKTTPLRSPSFYNTKFKCTTQNTAAAPLSGGRMFTISICATSTSMLKGKSARQLSHPCLDLQHDSLALKNSPHSSRILGSNLTS
jgi:hypothetical protein